jgi:RNA polymerase sigma-70 factor (ECF subfamily)
MGNGNVVIENVAAMKRGPDTEPIDQPTGELPDNELVSASQRDSSAIDSLYRRYHGRVYDFVLRRVGDAHRAEDITSQVFERALKALPAYRAQANPVSFRAWLFTIARNAVTDSYRRTRPQSPVEQLDSVPDPQPGPADHAIAVEAKEELRRVLGVLTSQQRQIVELRLAGFSGQEIAAELGMSLAAMKSAQYRAFETPGPDD